MTTVPTRAEERKAMRSAPWRAVPLAFVLALALWSCNGPNRGTNTQPSSASGFHVVVTASPNTISSNGGSSTIQVKVFDTNGQLVDGAPVDVTASPASDQGFHVSGTTNRGTFTTTFHAQQVAAGAVIQSTPGTVLITASAEDAFATTEITLF
jgi:hypothetical protein